MKANEHARRHEALKRTQQVEPVDYAAVLARDGYVCHICRQDVPPDDVEFDHVMPLSKGGAHSMENVKVSHRRCNRRKHARLDRWLR
jgi:5-methylcytosine-specific restriction endonuclease McrA